MNKKGKTDLHLPLLLSRKNENKSQYGPITENVSVEIINRIKLSRLT